MIDEIRCANALRLLEEVALLICKEPNKAALVWSLGTTKGRIDFEVGNSDDAIRLTGKSGKGIENISKLATVLFEDTGIAPYIGRITNLGDDSLTFKSYKPNPQWPKDKVKTLLKQLAEARFIETEIEVLAEDEKDRTEFFICFPRIGEKEIEFVRLIDKIFATVGTQQGRRITIDAERLTAKANTV